MSSGNDHRAIEVRPVHIESAIPENSARCMVAAAIKDHFPGATRIHVDLQTIRFTDDSGNRRTYLTPGKAQVGIVEFDAGDTVEPFKFHLNDPIHIRTKKKRKVRIDAVETTNAKQEIAFKESKPFTVTRYNGRGIPQGSSFGASTRRKFGIRGLRINQQGQISK